MENSWMLSIHLTTLEKSETGEKDTDNLRGDYEFFLVRTPEASGVDYFEAFAEFVKLHEDEIKGHDNVFVSFELEEEDGCGDGFVLGFAEWLQGTDFDAVARLMKRDGFPAYLEEKGMLKII